MNELILKEIGTVRSPFKEKFGVPRQSRRVDVQCSIEMNPPFDNPDAFRGIDGFSYLWIIWGFSMNSTQYDFAPTVRPPRLGGNERMGVFATRSPYRPNPIGLSLVHFDGMEHLAGGGVQLKISGGDMTDGTPVYDIKPYLPTEAVADAEGGFADEFVDYRLDVSVGKTTAEIEPVEMEKIMQIVAEDPRPAYHNDADRIYGMIYRNLNVMFSVRDGKARIEDIKEIEK